jgi:hypothetical protein
MDIQKNHPGESLTLATWNIAVDRQAKRIDHIAEHLASRGQSITILTELTELGALQKALTREIGSEYSLGAVSTGSQYEDFIGILVTHEDCAIIEDPEPILAESSKMPYFARTKLSTPLGEMTLAGMRGAYVSGRGGWLSWSGNERRAQYGALIDSVQGTGVAIVGGDMNSAGHVHRPIFEGSGFIPLTGPGNTWPDVSGLTNTTIDAQILARPFVLMKRGLDIDALYGRGPIAKVESRVQATGLSDHQFVETTIRSTASFSTSHN